ncbi:MAG: hypothetical protein A3D10_02775 [Omnitrophica WOR_2 bacterium RIFCSPHIGHO2_02_FULL_48_11]|nr:MAG: hypothetical protein A3D10_02775 [Omnitrophica WOR_2 bacterium RIFCSPHIGHO2_02_FULL_48_11]
MKRVVVLGNSLAGGKALADIRAAQPEAECLLVSLDGNLPYDPSRLAEYLAKDISQDDIMYQSPKYYAENNIQIILDKKIEKVNFKKNQLATDQKEIIGYDILIIAETPDHKFPDIKGTNKNSVFNLNKLADVNQLSKDLIFINSVVIQSDAWAGVQQAYALRKRGKEVLLIVSAKSVVAQLAEEGVKLITENLEAQGIRILFDSAIAEILGDGDVKAVRLKSGKVLAADAVLFDEVLPNLRIFQDSPLQTEQRIKVNSFLRTNIENVYAVDAVAELASASTQDLLEQGRVVAAVLQGQDVAFVPSLAWQGFSAPDLSVQWIGQTAVSAETQRHSRCHLASKIYKEIFVSENQISGAVLINAGQLQEPIRRAIQEKTDARSGLDNILNSDAVQTQSSLAGEAAAANPSLSDQGS